MAARTRRSTAYHEAGHAVAHHFFPCSGRTTRITIAPDELSEFNAGRHAVNKASGLHTRGTLIWPTTGRSIDREQVHHEIMALLAGPAAGWLYADHALKEPTPTEAQIEEARQHRDGGDDYSRAWRLIRDADPFDCKGVVQRALKQEHQSISDSELMEKYVAPAIAAECERVSAELSRCHREAFEFIVSKWPHVQALGDALFKKKTLKGDEVMAIIEAVEARIQQGPPDLWAAEP